MAPPNPPSRKRASAWPIAARSPCSSMPSFIWPPSSTPYCSAAGPPGASVHFSVKCGQNSVTASVYDWPPSVTLDLWLFVPACHKRTFMSADCPSAVTVTCLWLE